MIKTSHWETLNFENAMRGMRNPMNSWEKSDSVHQHIGPNDLDLLLRLTKAGTDHRKVLRQMMVSVDITAPLYWWKEFDTYKVGTVANSTSTMHKIHTKPFEMADFSTDQMVGTAVLFMAEQVIPTLESMRIVYLTHHDKKVWYSIIQLLPSSYNQTRTVTLNYEVLLNMYLARRKHKLQEWQDFCEEVSELPYFKEISEV